MDYEFPVADKFRARDVTEIDFEIEPESPAYVNLDDIRGVDFRNRILYTLNIDNDQLRQTTNQYLKIIFQVIRAPAKRWN